MASQHQPVKHDIALTLFFVFLLSASRTIFCLSFFFFFVLIKGKKKVKKKYSSTEKASGGIKSLHEKKKNVQQHIRCSYAVQLFLKQFSKAFFLRDIITVIIAMFWKTVERMIVFIYICSITLKSLNLLGRNQQLECAHINSANGSNIFQDFL